MPLPVPLAPEVIVSQFLASVAVHVHPVDPFWTTVATRTLVAVHITTAEFPGPWRTTEYVPPRAFGDVGVNVHVVFVPWSDVLFGPAPSQSLADALSR